MQNRHKSSPLVIISIPRKFRNEFLSPIGSHQITTPGSIVSLSKISKSSKKIPRKEEEIGFLKEK
jgi:hypothetical protein